MSNEFRLPNLGEDVQQAEVLHVLVREGDRVSDEQPVLEVESEKASLEVPCDRAGSVQAIHVQPGDTVEEGDAILTLDGEEAATDAAGQRTEKPDASETPAPEASETSGASEASEAGDRAVTHAQESSMDGPREPVFAAPSVRRSARELGVDLAEVDSSGPAGRITVDDVKRHAQADGEPVARGGQPGERERSAEDGDEAADRGEGRSLSALRKTIARRMKKAWDEVPHVTLHAEAELTALGAHARRIEQGSQVRISWTAIMLKVAAAALRRFPDLNAAYDPDQQVLYPRRSVDIAVAVDTDRGLLAPVVYGVSDKSVVRLAEEVSDLASKARNQELDRAALSGASFTLTNLGGLGVTHFTPIVTPPQVAVLGAGRARSTGGEDDRTFIPLSLSIDHRVVDGADGARFLAWMARFGVDPVGAFFEA